MAVEIEKLARILKVLGDQNRLGILFAIGKNSLSVTEIIRMTELSQTLVSFHLRALRKSAVVKTKRSGPFIYYSVSDPDLIDMLGQLSEMMKTKETLGEEVKVSVPT